MKLPFARRWAVRTSISLRVNAAQFVILVIVNSANQTLTVTDTVAMVTNAIPFVIVRFARAPNQLWTQPRRPHFRWDQVSNLVYSLAFFIVSETIATNVNERTHWQSVLINKFHCRGRREQQHHCCCRNGRNNHHTIADMEHRHKCRARFHRQHECIGNETNQRWQLVYSFAHCFGHLYNDRRIYNNSVSHVSAPQSQKGQTSFKSQTKHSAHLIEQMK